MKTMVSREFSPSHLSVNTRQLYLTYRQCVYDLTTVYGAYHLAGVAVQAAQERLYAARRSGCHRTACRWSVELERRRLLLDQARDLWRSREADANIVFRVLAPAMHAEGYPYQWWQTGMMKIPEGATL